MSAANTDQITLASQLLTRPLPTTLTTIKAAGALTISCNALTGWPTGSAVHFQIYTIDTSGAKVVGSQTDWKGVVSGTNISNMILTGGTDNGYGIGAVVEAGPTSGWANDLATAVTKDHDAQGRHVQLTDTNSKKVLGLTATASAVNDVVVANAATGAAPSIASEGTDSNIDLAIAGKGTGRVTLDGLKVAPVLIGSVTNYVISGGVISSSTTTISITACVAYINGVYVTAAAVTNRACTVSKDTYVDLKTDGTYAYVEVANNATSGMTLTASSMRMGKVVTSASAVVQVLQSPINLSPVSPNTTKWFGFDPIGNPVFNNIATAKIVGRGMNTSSYNTANNTTAQAVTDMTTPAILAANINYVIRVSAIVYNTNSSAGATITVWDGVVASGTLVGTVPIGLPTANNTASAVLSIPLISPSVGLHTYAAGFQAQAAGTAFMQSSATEPALLTVEIAA